jgi:hypothetical protein
MSGYNLPKTFFTFFLHRSVPCTWNVVACTCFLHCILAYFNSLLCFAKHEKDKNIKKKLKEEKGGKNFNLFY